MYLVAQAICGKATITTHPGKICYLAKHMPDQSKGVVCDKGAGRQFGHDFG